MMMKWWEATHFEARNEEPDRPIVRSERGGRKAEAAYTYTGEGGKWNFSIGSPAIRGHGSTCVGGRNNFIVI